MLLPALPDTQSVQQTLFRAGQGTAPAPATRSCKRARFFHGSTAARPHGWADGKVGALELELACAASLRAPPALLARASPGGRATGLAEDPGSTTSWCRSHARCGDARPLGLEQQTSIADLLLLPVGLHGVIARGSAWEATGLHARRLHVSSLREARRARCQQHREARRPRRGERHDVARSHGRRGCEPATP